MQDTKQLSYEQQIIGQQVQIQEFIIQQEAYKSKLKSEIKDIQTKINSYKQVIIPDEILQLQKEIQQKQSKILKESENVINQVKKDQHLQQLEQEQSQKQIQLKTKPNYTAGYFNQLKQEKNRLNNDIADAEKQMLQCLEQIEEAQKEERNLKQQLVYKEVTDESSSELFDHDKMVENLQQVDTELPQNKERYRNSVKIRSSSPIPKNIHSKCQALLKTYKNRTLIIKQAIKKMKVDFEIIIEKTIKALRECEMLESFYINGELALNQDEKEQLAARIAEDQGFVTALIRISLQGSNNVGLLKQDHIY
ncbi:hypothetical protein SS50377_23240 [Spironucleus salmonicida]|uniref:Uncharacterized protein n=1 Tax=Spironucleus salmonicida TaxID=348837 RepID=V6LK17_9EUKA|nr:hypothetical protein SS50377_23240 [Spironucleus salmonicida]|eukprot:EST44081.1 Hypothetical protein SS50377_16151 [Spironucleus salmonicida]